MPGGFVVVADEAELAEGEVRNVFVMGHPVLLCKVRGKLYACSAECTYDEGSDLAQGNLDGYHLRCPDHGCEFDVRSGRIVSPPAEEPLPTYDCKVENGKIWVSHRPRGM